MEEKIADLIYEYLMNNKEIDFYFTKNVIIIAKQYYGLDGYINKIFETDVKSKFQASYYINNGSISININSILSSFSNLKKEFEHTMMLKLFKYIYCVQILLHEIEHVIQQKKIAEYTLTFFSSEDIYDSIEVLILKEEFSTSYIAQEKNFFQKIITQFIINKIREKYYEFSPSERLAEIKSCKTTRNISKILNDELSYDIMESFLLQSLLSGYNVGLIKNLSDIPTKYFLDKINPNNNYFEILNLSKNITPLNSLELGLKVPEEILQNVSHKNFELINKIQKGKY